MDGLVREPGEALAARVLATRPDCLGLSVYFWSAQALAGLSRILKAKAPGLLIFAGGPEASANPKGFGALAQLDFLLPGEGEEASVQALKAIFVDGIRPSLGQVYGRPALADLGRLPSPWLSGLLKPKKGGALWELARGCPFHCSYCYEGKGEARIRRFPRERIEAELDYFVRSGVDQVFVLDPTFDADREGARGILELIARKAPGIHWKFEVRAELLDRDLARRFSRLDVSLQIGLQTANPEVSAAVRRPLDLKAFARGIGHLNAEGVIFGIDLIYGLPKDSLSGFRRSVDYALGLQPNHLDIFPLSVLPGTVLAEEAPGLGLVWDPEPPYSLVSTPGFPAEALVQARDLARACDLFYSRGRAVSWFLQALKPLKARPSAFLARFAATHGGVATIAGAATIGGEAPGDSRAIESAQRAFLETEYRARGLEALLPALMDIVGFNAAWGRALAEGEATRLELNYDPDEVLGPSALDLGAFARSARPRRGSWLVEPSPKGPRLGRR